MRKRTFGALVVVAALGAAGSAQGATQLGPALNDAGDSSGITGSAADAGTALNSRLASGTVAAPAGGIITKFRVRNASGALKLVVVAGAAPGRSVVASSAAVTPSGTGTVEFPVQIPIAAGQTVAIELGAGAKLGFFYNQGSSIERYSPPLTSAPRAPEYTDPADYQWQYNAVVEPDADGDGLGDETQDPDHGNPGGGGGGGGGSSADINDVRVGTDKAFMDTAGHVERTVGCPDSFTVRCSGRITYSYAGKKIASGKFSCAPGDNCVAAITVPKATRKKIRRHKYVTISARLSVFGVGARTFKFKLYP